MLTSFAFWWYCMVEIQDVILGIALFEIAHDVQYLAIVWLYNTRRVSEGGRLGGFTRFVFRRSGWLAGLYVGLVLAYGSLALGSEAVQHATLQPVLAALITCSALLHFYYDAFIWSVSDRKTSETLGLDAAAPVERWRAPAWIGHGARWAYLAAPLVLLTSLHGTNAPALSRALEARAAFPGVAEAHHQLGQMLMVAGDIEGAEASFMQALELRPGFALAQAGLGYTALMSGSRSRAEQLFERALALDPECANAWTGLGRIHFDRDHLELARETVDRARSLAPRSSEALLLDARLRHREGDLSHAETLYLQAADRFPMRAEIALELGLVYADQHRLREAASQFQRALELHPADARAERRLREVQEQLAAES